MKQRRRSSKHHQPHVDDVFYFNPLQFINLKIFKHHTNNLEIIFITTILIIIIYQTNKGEMK